MLSLILTMALSAPGTATPRWDIYACTEGPTIQVQIDDARPAARATLRVADATIELTHQAKDPKTVLRGGGYMLRPFNWSELLYAPPGRERQAYQCSVAGVEDRAGRPEGE